MTSFGTELHYSDNSPADFSISPSWDPSPLIYFRPDTAHIFRLYLSRSHPACLPAFPSPPLLSCSHRAAFTHPPPHIADRPLIFPLPPAGCDIKCSMGDVRDPVSRAPVSAVRQASVTVSTPVCR